MGARGAQSSPRCAAAACRHRSGRAIARGMNKFSCTMVAGGEDFFYVTLVAETAKEARELAAAESKRGTPRDWNAAILERDVPGPARVLDSGSREA